MEKETKIEYHINRYMMYSTDYVREYTEVDKFDNLKTARAYLKEMLAVFSEYPDSKKVFGSDVRDRNRKVEKVVYKYRKANGDDYLGIENKITKVIIKTNKHELKGV